MIVFLHGVPETAALWDKVRAEFEEETVALSLPGFGCARPSGFGATKDDYVDWLVAELETFDEPVDLVGHDWGALLTYRIATTRGRPSSFVDRRLCERRPPASKVAPVRANLADAR